MTTFFRCTARPCIESKTQIRILTSRLGLGIQIIGLHVANRDVFESIIRNIKCIQSPTFSTSTRCFDMWFDTVHNQRRMDHPILQWLRVFRTSPWRSGKLSITLHKRQVWLQRMALARPTSWNSLGACFIVNNLHIPGLGILCHNSLASNNSNPFKIQERGI